MLELEKEHKIKELEAESEVIHLCPENEQEIGHLLKEGETYISKIELDIRKRRSEDKRTLKFLDKLIEKTNDYKEKQEKKKREQEEAKKKRDMERW